MKNKINNKGFTLVELLAVVAILGIIMSIATISVVSTINESKTKSEKLFVKKLSQSIDDYIDLYSSNLKTTSNQYTFDKCTKNTIQEDDCPEDAIYSVNAYEVKENGITDITLQDLIDANLIEKSKLINPRNKLQCVDLEHNPTIKIYKDSDYVYYYKVDLSTSACEISEENNEINTLPDDLNRKVG